MIRSTLPVASTTTLTSTVLINRPTVNSARIPSSSSSPRTPTPESGSSRMQVDCPSSLVSPYTHSTAVLATGTPGTSSAISVANATALPAGVAVCGGASVDFGADGNSGVGGIHSGTSVAPNNGSASGVDGGVRSGGDSFIRSGASVAPNVGPVSGVGGYVCVGGGGAVGGCKGGGEKNDGDYDVKMEWEW
ncbi:hypothetical protein INT45_007418 [Circinella minor]|uniref:Uncharacterized protein n=1 Tax=Circinella minor TaxID=1195481 RepID=A0A8H7RNI5_9FUNG|nr:hypothetical protein INT45_007418 [Circinella minor]